MHGSHKHSDHSLTASLALRNPPLPESVLPQSVCMSYKLLLSALCSVAFASTAFAAQPTYANPVVDISGLKQPGLWEVTRVAVNGTTSVDPRAHTVCVTVESLRDVLNSSGGQRWNVTSYDLDGNHLHVNMQRTVYVTLKTGQLTVVSDIFFDSPTASHSVLESTSEFGSGKKTMRQKLKAKRVSDCTGQGAS